MAHSVEGRYPFLDYRVVEFCNRLPSNVKLSGLTEKWLLKQLGRKLLPKAIWQRTKRPYRAPIQHSFFGHSGAAHAYAQELWTEQALQESGLFKPAPVMQLAAKARSGANLSETEEMAVVGILSTQLVYDQFVKTFRAPAPSSTQPIHIKLVDRLSEVNTP